ncbi:TetR/AcrR family transcriptional regulator [Streptomyces candidus]|uniref:AcrR family transcriptional regulator n=1 Tax=Streptomyces candidus TaxID=67283 RepID=A0A7X0LQ10_9ACTN|nr:helix-turn-helix domain-containing protein [Streptomyces candidus]MBB6437113.1 AcrR family transcriptional regulator [Streptomyces candidus]
MHIQDSQWQAAVSAAASTSTTSSSSAADRVAAVDGTRRAGAGGPSVGGSAAARSAPLRVDAQRNLEHVLRAAREVFGELGYGAPMEDVARRARVGVGTVYRRFPSKDVLVRRIAEEETSRLTEQARAALGQEEEPWSALSRFLRTSVASGAGRLLPPQVLRVGVDDDGSGAMGTDGVYGGSHEPGLVRDAARVPQQRQGGDGTVTAAPDLRLVEQDGSLGAAAGVAGDTGTATLLDVVGQLVDRARASGELRGDVTVADVLLVIATAAPSLPDAAQQAAASARLLDILLEGLRSRPS